MHAYTLEPKNRFVAAISSLVERENNPGPTVSFLAEVDLTQVERVRARVAASGTRKPSYTAFVVKAVAQALREFPYANRRPCKSWLPFSGTRLLRFHACDVAVLCERDLPEAPMAAFADVLRDADLSSLDAITEWLRALAACDASSNKQWREFQRIITRLPHALSKLLIRMPHFLPRLWTRYRGGAVSVSSPAKYGVDALVATWPWPLGVSFGLVKPRALVREGQVVACPTFMLILNWDRRVMAGAQAARFFKRIVELLESAETELASPSTPRQHEAAGSAQEPAPVCTQQKSGALCEAMEPARR